MNRSFKKWGKASLLLLMSFVLVALAACGGKKDAPASGDGDSGKVMTIAELAEAAKAEGEVISIGMPDNWANWKDTWEDLTTKYGLKHVDTDMSSGEQLAKLEAEKSNATADIGDVGIAFGPVAKERGLTMAHKTEFWDEIPDWAKDDEGHWIVAYQGTIAIICNKTLVAKCPQGFEDMKNATDYQVSVGDVARGAQSQYAVLAAAIAYGGDESNIEPGIQFFQELAKKNLVSKVDVMAANLETGEAKVMLVWDFNALGYRDQVDPEKFEVYIPKEGSVVSGYTPIINKYAPHPNAAKLARSYILSDEGQINLAKGYARPIRDSVKLPDDVAAKMIPLEQYANAQPVKDHKVWEETIKELGERWEVEVMAHVK